MKVRSGKGKRGTVDFEAVAAWVPSVLGSVRGGMLHPAFAGVSQVLICVFGAGAGRGFFIFEVMRVLATT